MDLRKRIQDTGIRFNKVAEMLGVSNVMLSYWLNGNREMPATARKKIMEILDKYDKIVA